MEKQNNVMDIEEEKELDKEKSKNKLNKVM